MAVASPARRVPRRASASPAPNRFRRDDRPTDAKPGEARAEQPAKPRFDRSRYKGTPGDKPAFEGRRPDGRDKRPEGQQNRTGEKPVFQARPKPREEAPVRFDPDSPFAKLAALRDQLKK